MHSWVEISKQNLEYNVKQLRKIIGKKTKLLAVVKANAYGHGMLPVAKIVEPFVDWFGVAGIGEAIELKKNRIKKPVLVLNYYGLYAHKNSASKNLIYAVKQGISFGVFTTAQLDVLTLAAKKAKRKAKIHLEIDTGLSRSGQRIVTIDSFLKKLVKYDKKLIFVEGVYSHFASSEENLVYTEKQIRIFNRAIGKIKNNLPDAEAHIACSAAAVLHPASRYDMIRPGIMLYGLHPSKKTHHAPGKSEYVGKQIDLKPVMTWKTEIIQVKDIVKTAFVGYGLSYQAKRNMKLAVISTGYADGLDRGLSNIGEVLVRGKKAKIIGRICMNVSMIDVTGLGVKISDEVVIIGKQKKERIRVEDIAEKIGTINYEVVTRINWNLPRIVI